MLPVNEGGEQMLKMLLKQSSISQCKFEEKA